MIAVLSPKVKFNASPRKLCSHSFQHSARNTESIYEILLTHSHTASFCLKFKFSVVISRLFFFSGSELGFYFRNTISNILPLQVNIAKLPIFFKNFMTFFIANMSSALKSTFVFITRGALIFYLKKPS